MTSGLNILFLALGVMVGGFALVFLFAVVSSAISKALSSPFHYPYFVENFDVSGRRNVDLKDCVDGFLMMPENRLRIIEHRKTIESWKQKQQEYLETCLLKKRRNRQYVESLDDEHAYRFQTIRAQTRYRQQNYIKESYKVNVADDCLGVDWAWLCDRNRLLAKIDYEATLKDYHAKNQRRLMTPKLRQEIKVRDDYTCQKCGKHMPDEVGLHIDHIVPIAKGGKTVPTNLQVLCSKCNGQKGSKTEGYHVNGKPANQLRPEQGMGA